MKAQFSVEIMELSQSEIDELESEISPAQSSITKLTDHADLFNDFGTSEKWHIRVELWGEHDDPHLAAKQKEYVAMVVHTGEVRYCTIPSKIRAVNVRFSYYDTKSGKYYGTAITKPDPIFGARTYFSETALFWFANSPDGVDRMEIGGDIHQLP